MAVPMSKKVGEGYKSLDREELVKKTAEKIESHLAKLKRLGHMILVGGITPNAREVLALNGIVAQMTPLKNIPIKKYYIHLPGRVELGYAFDTDWLDVWVELPCGCSLVVRYDLICGETSKLFVIDVCDEHEGLIEPDEEIW